VYEKYDITYPDAELAVEYLRCFFDARRARPNELIILPQIADWAWHELILDTARYRALCSNVFGNFLHHVATTLDFDEFVQNPKLDARDLRELNPKHALSGVGLKSDNLREDFSKSLNIMDDLYGLGLGDNPEDWLGAGWDRPMYRLRKPVRLTYISDLDQDRANSDAKELGRIQFFSWLPNRIVQRFGIPIEAALRGVREYSGLFFSLGSTSCSSMVHGCSIQCAIAWDEHVLWTQRYAEDCYRVFGHFLDRPPSEFR
jgi:hypothetical protein